MFKNYCLVAAVAALAATASAQWTYEKHIDLSGQINGSLLSIASDSNGDLYLTTYFGTGDRPVYKVSDPLGATPVLSDFATPGYTSSNGSDLSVDSSDNVWLCHDTNSEATSFIKKMTPAGTLDAAFASAGTVSPVVFNVAGTPTNRRPRSITYVEGGKLLVFSWGNPMLLQVLDASTGAPIGDAIDVGVGTGISDSMHDMVYDASTNAITGSLRGNLFQITSSNASATLANLPDYSIFTKLAGDDFPAGNSNSGGTWDPTENLYAFTSSKTVPGSVTVVDLDDTGNQTVIGPAVSESGHLGNAGDCTFFRSGGELYLAINCETLGDIAIYSFNAQASVTDWVLYQ
ncbi:MAG: hypothetical protein PWP23_1523 [Candidatus Sumerlaeota bacterium]|nr:hypothetical protein [Candidatus Sumerlaeota bacterium]